jgi:beta-lactamase regulating signal transducer with metallopeptidase domain
MNTAVGLPFSEIMIERLGWVFVHSLWQFTLVAFLAAVVLRLMGRSSAEARSGVLIALLLLCMGCPIGTWILHSRIPVVAAAHREEHQASPRSVPPLVVDRPVDTSIVPAAEATAEQSKPAGAASPTTVNTPIDAARQSTWTEQAAAILRPWLAWMVGFWVLGVVLCSLRPLMGLVTLRRLKRVGVSQASNEVLAALALASKRLGLRRSVQILESSVANVPLVVGYLRPVILLPIGLLTNVPATQLEAILAHELAHIRRHDFVANLLQVVIETLFFYHPAVWWLSYRIRVEREHCCDDLVVGAMDNRVEYGRALIAIAELRGQSSTLSLAASDGSLLGRVRRLAGDPNERTGLSACIGFCLIACLISTVLAMSFVANSGVAAMDDNTAAEANWGDPVNGLRVRVVPVHADMSEEDVDMDAVQRKFKSQENVAFAVEMENVSDQPIKILDTGYGNSFGESSGKPNSDWYSQFLFSIEYFDADGKKLEYPHVEHVTPDMIVGSAKVSEIAPASSHRFLIRPAKWRSIMYQRLKHHKYTAIVHYHGLQKSAADRIGKRRRDRGRVLETWSGDIASSETQFQIARPVIPRTKLYWGAPSNGLRSAMSLSPFLPWYGHGQKVDTLLHVQNVSDKPITLASEMWLTVASLTVEDKDGNPVKFGPTVSRGGFTPMCRTTLQPDQTIVLEAGNLGLAKTQEEADGFDYVVHGTMVVPTGDYKLQLNLDSRRTPRMQDGEGNPLAPLDGDYVGTLKTTQKRLLLKEKPFDMSNEEAENSSTPRQWAEIYVNQIEHHRNADGNYPASVLDTLRKSLQHAREHLKSLNQDELPGAEAWLAAIDAKETWTHEELFAHVLDLSEWSFSVVNDAYYDELGGPSSAPKPGRMPSLEELVRLPFGEAAKNGLRVAWVFDPGALARVGETVSGNMVFHNSGDESVTFSVEPWGWTDWMVRNQHGDKVRMRHIPLAFWIGTYVRFHLEPGQIAETIGEPLGFGELSKVDQTLATTWIPAKAGDVLTVGGQVKLKQGKSDDGEALKGDWVGSLKIKERKFTITEVRSGGNATASADADPATLWAGYFANQVSHRQNKDGTYPSSAFRSLKKYLRAYEIEGSQVDKWITKADAKQTWQRAEFLAHVKDIAEWSISTVHHAFAEEERAVMNIPKLGRQPRGEELDVLPFGRAAPNGLRVAWVFERDSKSGISRIGDVFNSRVVFHNAGREPITFSTLLWPDATWKLSDADGEKIEARRLLTSLNLDWQRIQLLPDHLMEIPAQPVGLGNPPHNAPALAKTWFPAKPGQIIDIAGKFPMAVARPVDGGTFENDWTEPLDLKSQSIVIAETAVEENSNPAARASKAADVSTGLVMDSDGKAVPRAEVLVYQGQRLQKERFVTDDKGKFQIPRAWRDTSSFNSLVVRDGDHRIGWFSFNMHKHSNGGQKPNVEPFRIQLLPMTVKVPGRVVNKELDPIESAEVLVELINHDHNLMGTHFEKRRVGGKRVLPGDISAANGDFTVLMPEGASGTLRVHHPDYASQRIHLGLYDVQDPQLTVLKPAAKIIGIVQDSRSGRPIAGVRIAASASTNERIAREHGGWGEAVSDEKGRYEIGGLTEGTWGVMMLECPDKKLTAPAIPQTKLFEGQTTDVHFSLKLGQRVYGTLTEAKTGKPIPNWPMQCSPSSRGGGVIAEQTNENGVFEFFVPPGKVRIYVSGNRERAEFSDVNIVVKEGEGPKPLAMTAGTVKDDEDGGLRYFTGLPLERKVSLKARRMPLHKVLKDVCDQAGLILDLDANALKYEGYTRNMPITIELDNVKLRDALHGILRPLEQTAYTIAQLPDAPPGCRLFVSSTKGVEKREAAANKGLSERKLKEIVLTGIVQVGNSQEAWLRHTLSTHFIVEQDEMIRIEGDDFKLRAFGRKWVEWEVGGETKRLHLGDSFDRLEDVE